MLHNRNRAHSLPSGEIIFCGNEFNDHTDLVVKGHQNKKKKSKFLAAALTCDDIYMNNTLTFSCVCLVFSLD